MSQKSISCRAIRKQFQLSAKKIEIENNYRINVEQAKRQRILSGELFNYFSPKHYPSIFLDQRLKSSLF